MFRHPHQCPLKFAIENGSVHLPILLGHYDFSSLHTGLALEGMETSVTKQAQAIVLGKIDHF